MAYARDPKPRWLNTAANLSPLGPAPHVPTGTHIRLLVGTDDDVAPVQISRPNAEALQARGIDARLRVEPGLTHDNIVSRPAAIQELLGLVADVGGASSAAP